jgi:hypothetical protein
MVSRGVVRWGREEVLNLKEREMCEGEERSGRFGGDKHNVGAKKNSHGGEVLATPVNQRTNALTVKWNLW